MQKRAFSALLDACSLLHEGRAWQSKGVIIAGLKFKDYNDKPYFIKVHEVGGDLGGNCQGFVSTFENDLD
jgi:hypothetical protein